MPWTVIISTVATGRVERWTFWYRRDALAYARRFAPVGRADGGRRVEVVPSRRAPRRRRGWGPPCR